MKPEPPIDSRRWRAAWKAIIGSLLVIILPVVTVLGAVVLSLQGQVYGQLVAQRTDSAQEEYSPTAAVTSPAVTLHPTTLISTTIESAVVASPTLRADFQPEIPSPTSEIAATMPVRGTAVLVPSFTPWPCAGYAPMDWNLYIVVRGDTLFSLARRHNTSMDEAILYNCLTSDQLWAGQRLYLPGLPTREPSATVTLTSTPTPTSTPVSPPSPSSTVAPTTTATPSPTPFATETVSSTPDPSPSPTATFTPSVTMPASPTATATTTATVPVQPTTSPTLTSTPSATPSMSPTPTVDPAVSPSASPTSTETLTPSPAP